MSTVSGELNGKPSSLDSIKKKVEFQGLKIKIDRPIGFIMRGTSASGDKWERKYKYDYGFIPKTNGGDGDGIDVFLGPIKDDQETYWARQIKDDGSFDEYKVFLGFGSREAATKAYKEHIPAKYLSRMVTIKIPMMRAMLGMDPDEKTAMYLGFLDELRGLARLPNKS